MPQFTKKAIMDSFIELLNKNPFDKITVKEIVEHCGINRNTFYYYFQDIYDLLEQLFMTEAQKVIEENHMFDSWQDGFLQSAKFVFENKTAIHHIYTSISKDQLEKYLYNITEKMMVDFVRQEAIKNNLTVREEDIKYIAIFYKYALVGIALSWIENGMKEDPKEAISKFGDLFDGSIKTALIRVSKNNI